MAVGTSDGLEHGSVDMPAPLSWASHRSYVLPCSGVKEMITRIVNRGSVTPAQIGDELPAGRQTEALPRGRLQRSVRNAQNPAAAVCDPHGIAGALAVARETGSSRPAPDRP